MCPDKFITNAAGSVIVEGKLSQANAPLKMFDRLKGSMTFNISIVVSAI